MQGGYAGTGGLQRPRDRHQRRAGDERDDRGVDVDPAAQPWLTDEISDTIDDRFGEILCVDARRLLLSLVGIDLNHVTSD